MDDRERTALLGSFPLLFVTKQMNRLMDRRKRIDGQMDKRTDKHTKGHQMYLSRTRGGGGRVCALPIKLILFVIIVFTTHKVRCSKSLGWT